MTKIKNKLAYSLKKPIALTDYVIGTNDETSAKATRNFQMSDIRDLIISGLSPIDGGELKITEIEYNGELTSPSAVANALNPTYAVAQYELVVFNINGNKFILKLQDITLGVLQDAVTDDDFVNLIGFVKLGDGTGVLKGYNVSTGYIEYYSLKSTGLEIAIVDGNIVIESKAGTNLSETGQKIYKGLNATTKLHEFYTMDSTDFTITEEGGKISINNPVINDTPRFYVNNGYDIGGTAPETGSPSKPYKTIQQAITACIGTGSAQSPQFATAEIIIQKGTGYTYTGNLVLNGPTIILEENADVASNPAAGDWLCDFDTLSDTLSASLSIVLKEGAILQLSKNGFRNRGTSIDSGLFSTSKVISISGSGIVFQSVQDVINTNYTILESNFTTGDTYKNDGSATFGISGTQLYALTQQVYKVGGNSVLSTNNSKFLSSIPGQSVNVNLKAFEQIGGQVRINKSDISFLGNARNSVFSLTKNTGIPCELFITDCSVSGVATSLFKNENTNQALVNIKNVKSNFATITNIASSPSVLWQNFAPFGCIFDNGEVLQSEVDLTLNNSISTSNIFGGKLVESLQVFSSRADAVSSGALKKGNAFINRKTVTAVDLVAGVEYQVLTAGSPSLGTVGSYFTATGSETGTGTAYSYTVDTLI